MRWIPALGLLLLLAACGDGPRRPALVSTWPPNGGIVWDVQQDLLLTFDEPVVVLDQLAISTWQNGVRFSMYTVPHPTDPNSVITAPIADTPFGVGWVSVKLQPGLVVNGDGHYSLDEIWFGYGLNAEPPASKLRLLPASETVAVLDPATGDVLRNLETPGARPAIGLVVGAANGTYRSWVQLAHGGGAGAALAVVHGDGQAGVRALSLTRGPGGDLLGRTQAIALSLDGRSVYAAFRDTASGGVRLTRLDTDSERETDSLLLSAETSGDTWPTGLELLPDGSRVHVSWVSATGSGVIEVDTATWAEVAWEEVWDRR